MDSENKAVQSESRNHPSEMLWYGSKDHLDKNVKHVIKNADPEVILYVCLLKIVNHCYREKRVKVP